jgi:hypothetical protein
MKNLKSLTQRCKRSLATALALALVFALAAPLTAFATPSLDGRSVFTWPEVEVAIDGEWPSYYWFANEVQNSGVPYVSVNDVARDLGDSHIAFAPAGSYYKIYGKNEQVKANADTYVVLTGTKWSQSRTILESTAQDLVKRTVSVWYPNEKSWKSFDAYESRSTSRGATLMISVYDIPAFFPNVSKVELVKGTHYKFNLTKFSPDEWNDVIDVRTSGSGNSVTPGDPTAWDRYQSDPNGKKVTRGDVINSLYYEFNGGTGGVPNVSISTVLSWAVNHGIMSYNAQGKYRTGDVATQAEIYTMVSNALGGATDWSQPGNACTVSTGDGFGWAHPSLNRAYANDWFYYDYSLSKGLSQTDFARLIVRAFTQEGYTLLPRTYGN